MKTMLKLMAATVIMSSLSGCIGYGYQQAVLTPEQREQMAYDSQRVQDTERVERAERRAERHEERMSQAGVNGSLNLTPLGIHSAIRI